jgi:peptidoglycan/xylan/chitin deacetylase (PgdA/CDA1 family)
MYHLIKRVGFLVTDDYVFGAELGFEQGMVSVTFDDSYGNHYDTVRPILAANGIPATFYVISGLLGQPNRMTPAQVQQLASGGHEIGSHSIVHPDLTTLGQTDLNLQLGRSQADLEELLDLPVRNFAYPFGALNSSVQASCVVYYRTCRTTVYGYNTTSFTPGALVVQYVQRTTTEAEVRSWIDSARSGRSWLVLVYHSITSTPPNIEDTTPTALSAHMAYLRASGVPVRTIEDGATAVRPATDTVAPHTAVNSHVDGAGIDAGPVAVSAAAYDTHGVTGVDLLVDDGLVGTDIQAPYRFTWEASEGSHTLRTVARDAAGNTGSSPPVAVSVGDSLYEETWPGADNASWPAAWTTDAANGTVDTQGGAGRLTFNDVAYARGRAQLTGVPAGTDNEVVFAYRWAQNTAVGWFNVFLRGSGGWSNEYRPRNGYGIQLSTNSGTVTVQKNVNGAITNLRSVTGAQQVSTNKQWVRLRVSGSQIQFRTWVDGQVEPTTWRATVADTSLAAGGQLFLAFTRSSANTGIKSVAVDDLTLRRIGT